MGGISGLGTGTKIEGILPDLHRHHILVGDPTVDISILRDNIPQGIVAAHDDVAADLKPFFWL